MAKLYKIKDWWQGLAELYFHCPGCGCDHGVWLSPPHEGGPKWNFNGDMNKPTFTPSIRVTSSHGGIEDICHSFITEGRIQYCGDSTHKLAGQTVDLPDIE